MKKAGIPASVYTFNALLRACGKGDQWEEALKVRRRIHKLKQILHKIRSM
jgi:pentatricopeptide repeat protein